MTLGETLELARKFLLILGPIGVALWTVFEFSASARIEARKPFLERQLGLCLEATRVAAIIATATDEEHRKKANDRFWELYWGELVIVENNEVKTAMNNFKHALDKLQTNTPLNPERPESSIQGPQLETLSLLLGEKCRDLIAESWDTELEALK